jgi:hypothetical protein
MCERCSTDMPAKPYFTGFGIQEVNICFVCALDCGLAARPDSDFTAEEDECWISAETETEAKLK